jgi:hypothetical protein
MLLATFIFDYPERSPPKLSNFLQYGKMASGPAKAFCMLVFHETKYIGAVQRQFWQKYGKIPPRTL